MGFKATTTLDKAFEVSLLLKGADGILEIIGGLLLLFVSPKSINHLAVVLTQHEIIEDHNDFFTSHLLSYTHHLTDGALLFGAIYLLAHGIVKIVLIAEILRNRLWAYKGLIVLTIGFIIYQMYRYAYTHSTGLLLLSIFDVVVVYLTLKEYRKRQSTMTTRAD